jgi:chemotaxis family two-component system response regulator Rcp1
VHVVSDGQQALSFLKQTSTSAHEEKPALILLDLNLPKHDGMEILSFVRLDNRLASIPVIVLTSSDSPRDRSTATQLHATEYVRKPSSLEECVTIGSVIQRVLAHNLDGESSHETPTELLSAEALRTNS